MSQSNLRNSLPRIRKILPKSYVDIRYILKPSPVIYRNCIQGHNLIKRNESYKNIKEKVGKNKSRISEEVEGNGISQGSNGFIQFSMKETNNQKYHIPTESKIRSPDQRKLVESTKNSVELQKKRSKQNIYQFKSNNIIEKLLEKFERAIGPRGFVRGINEKRKPFGSNSSRGFVSNANISKYGSVELGLSIGKEMVQKIAAKPR